jgi:hypothetical protein
VNVTKLNPAPSPSGHALLSGPPTLKQKTIFTRETARTSAVSTPRRVWVLSCPLKMPPPFEASPSARASPFDAREKRNMSTFFEDANLNLAALLGSCWGPLK